jgi:hypothetical protein
MPEEIKLNDSLFGYDSLLQEGDEIIALRGKSKPELLRGMKVVMVGDSDGYIASGHKTNDEATILEFRKPFRDGSTDYIIFVGNNNAKGWVKPSNIKKV